MNLKDKNLLPVIIIISFIFGIVIGYVIHTPETIEKPVYINNTVEKIVEKPVYVTVTPTPTLLIPTATAQIPDFTVMNYDPFKDKPIYNIKLRNWAADPNTLLINPGETVLINIADTSISSPLTLILNNSYKKSLGTSGAVIVTFNKKGIYTLEAIFPSSDPGIIPRIFAEGMITVR